MKLKNELEDVLYGLTISEGEPQEPIKEQDVAKRLLWQNVRRAALRRRWPITERPSKQW